MDKTTEQNIQLWLKGEYDQEVKDKIQQMLKEDPQAVIDSFYTHLSFGTGGLRGIMGIGSNRMNVYTVRAATQGVANYIKKVKKGNLSAFIGYDSRHHSKTFAEECARVLAGNGFKVYLCNELRPTPFVSFGCRKYGCDTAIMITASHNPPEYNGYKVYWDDGGQVLPPHDKGIIDEVNQITDPSMVLVSENGIETVDKKLDEEYLQSLATLQHYPDQNHEHGSELSIVYSSLHGTGTTLMQEALNLWGFSNLSLVEKQCVPDGNFSTVESPNPEERSALEMGIQQLEEVDGDLLIATDPDADRVGVAVHHNDSVHLLTGNQIACLCLEHICNAGNLPKNPAFVKTIGTSELFKAICDEYSVSCFDVLTGFKYIAELMQQWEQDQTHQFVFGGEESYGYLLGNFSHDKDAIVSAALISEVALQAKRQDKTLIDFLYDLYAKYGVYVEQLKAIKFPESKEGKEQMTKGIEALRRDPPKRIRDMAVVKIEDYLTSKEVDLKSGIESKLELPVSNVLRYWLADGSKLMIRPSGTEPKVKIYCGVVMKEYESVGKAIRQCEEWAKHLIKGVEKLLTSQG